MNSLFGEILGYVAGAGVAFTFLPQTIKIIKTKNTKSLSLTSYVLYNINLVSWIFYGIYLKSFQIVFFNCISEVFAIIMLIMIITQNNKK